MASWSGCITGLDYRGYVMYTVAGPAPVADKLELYERAAANTALFSSAAFNVHAGTNASSGTFAAMEYRPFELTVTRTAAPLFHSRRVAIRE